MTISPPTVIAYSAVLFAAFGILFVLFWLKDGGQPRYLWCAMPFFMGVCGGAVVVDETLLPEGWALRLAVWFILMAYGFGWQAIRIFYDLRPLPLAVLLPATAWALLNAILLAPLGLLALSGTLSISIGAAFNALAAYELWRNRAEALQSRAYLFWIFAVYAAWAAVRAPIAGLLPAPLGVGPNEVWATALYNLQVVTQAILVTAFLISLSRERIAFKHYNMAMMDPLTGIYNRRALEQWGQEWRRGLRKADARMALLLLDIDFFKTVNDRFGHEIGDDVIVIAARVAERMLRDGDKVFRIGGEEFVCVFPDTSADEAFLVAERLRSAFRVATDDVAGRHVAATLSIGIASVEFGERDLDHLLAAADAALYTAKRSGRDCSMPSPPTVGIVMAGPVAPGSPVLH